MSALEGVKVLDLTRILAGPLTSMVLGDLGATIYKVESPTGDETRHWTPNIGNAARAMSCYFACVNRNKKSICVNLKRKEGLDIIYGLAARCDVLIENFVPGKLDGMGLGYGKMREVNPELIYCSVTGFGSRGLYKNRPGYDNIAASIGGLFHATGPKGGDPCKPGVALTDIATGLYAHGAILAALYHRTKTGRGQKIDVNLLSTQVATLVNLASNYLNAGKEAVRWGTEHESLVIQKAMKTKDGYVTVGTGTNAQFKAFCHFIGLDHLINDERFETNPLRVQNRDVLLPLVEPFFLGKTTAEVLALLDGAPFPFGPINTIKQEVRAIKVTLKKPKSEKQVKWTSETVDNEDLNRKKSKCCCIYEKPKSFGESSSEDEGECENCFGHVELKKKNDPPPADPQPPPVPTPDS